MTFVVVSGLECCSGGRGIEGVFFLSGESYCSSDLE